MIEGGYQDYDRRLNKNREEQQDRLHKEYQKMELEISDLVNKVADYEKTKDNARYAFWISVASVGATIIIGLLQLKK